MTILYIISKYICFPGAYMRAFWEHITCKILMLQVEPGKYVKRDEASGHIEHSLAKTQWSAWLMATGPGFLNFNLGSSLFLFGFLSVKYMGITPWDKVDISVAVGNKMLQFLHTLGIQNMYPFYIYLIAMYLGVSLLCNVFPLTEDIINYWSMAYGPLGKKSIAKSTIAKLNLPLAGITRLGAFLDAKGILFILWVVYLILEFTVFM